MPHCRSLRYFSKSHKLRCTMTTTSKAIAWTPAEAEARLSSEAAQFVESTGSLFRSWGGDRNAGRVLAYFLIKGGPASLDQLEAALDLPKSALSPATRILESAGTLE